MDAQDDQFLNTQSEHQEQHTDTNPKASAQRVDSEKNIEEKDLKTKFLFGSNKMKDANAPGMEGEGMGGHQFGGDSNPPTGDDPHNPSQNAGYSNAYFSRTEPSVEHPEDNNFKSQRQQGEPDYQTTRPNIPYPNANQQDTESECNTDEPNIADHNE